jgi:uncharacterized membrane protein
MSDRRAATISTLPDAEAGGAGALPARIAAIDALRTLALLGMAAFHLTYDLAMFGLVPAATVTAGYWPLHARAVAGTFIALAGLSLWLAHGTMFQPRAFLRRLAVLAGAALLVSAGTYAVMPQVFVYFGILHAIATFSVLGLLFLRMPWWLTLLAAAGVYGLAATVALPAFDRLWLVWTGLGTTHPVTVDYEPVFPWFGAFLLGLAAGQAGSRAGLWARLSRVGRDWPAALLWPGRHSLAIYLIHQPVLIGLVWLYAQARA